MGNSGECVGHTPTGGRWESNPCAYFAIIGMVISALAICLAVLRRALPPMLRIGWVPVPTFQTFIFKLSPGVPFSSGQFGSTAGSGASVSPRSTTDYKHFPVTRYTKSFVHVGRL